MPLVRIRRNEIREWPLMKKLASVSAYACQGTHAYCLAMLQIGKIGDAHIAMAPLADRLPAELRICREKSC